MVKFAGVRNYIVGTWNDTDLAACADLNLPCANITAFLPEPMDHGPNAGKYGTHDYLVCEYGGSGRGAPALLVVSGIWSCGNVKVYLR